MFENKSIDESYPASTLHHIRIAANIARSLSGTALDTMTSEPGMSNTSVVQSENMPSRNRRSTVSQHRLSKDQTTPGRKMFRNRRRKNFDKAVGWEMPRIFAGRLAGWEFRVWKRSQDGSFQI